MVTGIKFSTGSVFSEVYLNDKRLGNHNTVIAISPGTYNFEVRATGCDPIKLSGIVVVSDKVTTISSTDSRMKLVRYWTPPTQSVWQGISMIPYNCEGSIDANNWYIGDGLACYAPWSLVINIAHAQFDTRLNVTNTGIKSVVKAYVDSKTKIAIDSINSASGSNLLDKLKEIVASYKSLVISDSSGSWAFSAPLTSSYETKMKVATAEWQWWVVGCYRDKSYAFGRGFYVVDSSPQKTIDKAVSVLQSKLDSFGTWLFDIVQTSCDEIGAALSDKYNSAVVADINTYIDDVVLPTGFVDSQSLRTSLIDIRSALDTKLNEYNKTLSDMFSISAATTSKFASSRIAAVSRLDARVSKMPVIRLTGKRSFPSSVNWSGTNRFGVEVTNVGGSSFKGWFGYRFVDVHGDEHVYNTPPSVVQVVAPGETAMLNTDIPFGELFPSGSPGKLRVKLIPFRSDS